ncbi:restriction endonuclease subunit S [Rodentibacter caecimuris]|uniref:restriction endonuclease subunit S n=1 Tax=Rodentibacter caecimuris TaxID=1796644 RepID=UPI00101AEC72
MKSYEQYKPSGVAWLGDVPEHWEVKRLKFMATIQNGQDYKHIITDEGYPVIGSGGQFAYANDYLYDGESILLGRKGTIDKPLYINGKFWTVDTMFYTQINKNTVPKFLYYCTLTVDFWRIATQTALPSVTATALSNLQFAVPPLKEQTAIAAYLDERTAYLDRLIAKQQALSEKLSEKRTALITEAVCGRLDINTDNLERVGMPTLRDNGIQWLGDIPEHWELKRLRFLCNIQTGNMDTQDNDPDGIYPFYVRSPTVERSNNYTFENNEAVLMAGDGVGAGKVFHYVQGKYGCHQRVYSLNNFNGIAGKFLFYYLREFFSRKIEEGGAKSTVDSVRLPMLKDFPVATPPETEQTTIATFLDKETAKIDRLQAKIAESIARLKEYRAALITQTITGKIKV